MNTYHETGADVVTSCSALTLDFHVLIYSGTDVFASNFTKCVFMFPAKGS